jgi:GT2 family glycosyltransferase
LHILVLDNGSVDDPCDRISQNFPMVQTIRLARNVGFAAGCNIGIHIAMAAGTDFVLLLNNDTVVSQDFLQPLVGYVVANPEAAIVGPLIYDMESRDRILCAGGRINYALGRFGHSKTLPVTTSRKGYVTDYVTGCCMLIRRIAFERIGYFDEHFFAYFEDVDLCVRAREAGFAPTCIPRSIIWHKESASTRRGLIEGGTSSFKHYLIARNRIYLVKKHASCLSRAFFFAFTNPSLLIFYTVAFLLRRRWAKLRGMWMGTSDGWRGHALASQGNK